MDKLPVTLRAHANAVLVICLCFLACSTGYLSWLYNVMSVVGQERVEFCTLVLGYAAQAVGIGIYALVVHATGPRTACRLFVVALCAHVLALVPAAMSGEGSVVLAAGYVLNAFYGIIQGHYLAMLASQVEADSRGTVFGVAYGVSTLLSLLLSLPGNGMLCAGAPSVGCCLVILATVLLIVRMEETSDDAARASEAPRTPHDVARVTEASQESNDAARGKALVLVVATIAVAGIVKTIGFSFPSADLSAGFSLELTRVLYGVGLVVVGMVADHDRRLAMAVCAASLVAPFLMLSLSSSGVTGMVLWLLGYLLAGVYVLFSVLVAADVACEAGCPELAGLGMAVRYAGDVVGTALFLSLSDKPAVLVAISAVAFATAATLFVLLYQQRYSQDSNLADCESAEHESAERERTERERFVLFATGYALTQRERDVLRLILDEKSNSEIAGELVITERTVKFHVSNLLKKTDCKTRSDVLAKYAQQS